MNWIKVKDGLPEPGSKVIFCSKYNAQDKYVITCGWYRPSKDENFPWRDGYGSGDGPSVTHWCLAELPND